MALSKKPVNGMKDILPAEMEIRDYVTSVIKDTYSHRAVLFFFKNRLSRIFHCDFLCTMTNINIIH